MILPGRTLLTRSIIQNLKSPSLQVQPCGVDLTLKRILTFTSRGTVDFDNTNRQTSSTVEIPFPEPTNTNTSQDNPPSFLTLTPGPYLIEFNETVSVPLDVMGQIFVRSSLFRSGVAIHAGVMDAGYRGAVGALMQVFNEQGVRVSRDARVAQMVFQCLSGRVERGYEGVYQAAESLG